MQMNDAEKHELNAWLAEHLFGYHWYHIGDHCYLAHPDNPHANLSSPCQKPTEVGPSMTNHLPDWLGADWPTVAEEMRLRGCWVKVILRPDNHKSPHKYYCEIESRSEKWLYLANADSPGEAVGLVVRRALEGG